MLHMNERSVEYQFVFDCITKYAPKKVLDFGTGQTALPLLVEACGIKCDSIDNDPKQIAKNKALKPKNVDIMDLDERIKYDMILCVSVLEHIVDYNSVVWKMQRLLNDAGHLVLTFPFNCDDYVNNAYELPKAGYGKRSGNLCRIYNMESIKGFETTGLGMSIVDFWEVFSGKYWTEGKRLEVPRRATWFDNHQLACVCMANVVIRDT